MAQQYTTVYSRSPMLAANQMANSPIMQFADVFCDKHGAYYVAGMRKNGDDIALRFERTPAQYVRDMRAIHGGK